MEKRYKVCVEYKAGIWKGDLSFFLLWAPTIKQKPGDDSFGLYLEDSISHEDDKETYFENNCSRPGGEYRAPSWSWAGIDGPVRFQFDTQSLYKNRHEK